MGSVQILWPYSCIQRSEVRPEKRQEFWHYTALHLTIKCSRVRDVLACNQWRAMLAWNRGTWKGSTEERIDTWKTVRKEKLVKE